VAMEQILIFLFSTKSFVIIRNTSLGGIYLEVSIKDYVHLQKHFNILI